MLDSFAHAGYEQIEFLETTNGILLLNLAPFLLLALILFLFHRLRLPRNSQLIFSLIYFLGVGLLGYRLVPIASIISIVTGFGLSLAWVMLPFKK